MLSGITSEPQTETLSARGTNVEFTCVVDRYPPNTVAWYKGEDKIQEYDNRKDVSTKKFLKLFNIFMFFLYFLLFFF